MITVQYYYCKVFALHSYNECAQYLKDVGRVYLECADLGSKTNQSGLRHMKVENKIISHAVQESRSISVFCPATSTIDHSLMMVLPGLYHLQIPSKLFVFVVCYHGKVCKKLFKVL